MIIASVIASFCVGALGFAHDYWGNGRRMSRAGTVMLAGGYILMAFGLLAERYQPALAATQRDATQRNETGPDATEPNPALPYEAPTRYAGIRQRDFAERWDAVYRELGEPPAPEAVPVLGYVSGGVKYSARWRMPPDGEKNNNLKH